MNLIQTVVVALRSLQANKLRSALTILGVVIGVASVVALMSMGRGFQAFVNAQIESLGTNLLFVRPGATQQQGVSAVQGSAATLTLEDAVALTDPAVVPAVALISPQISTFGQVVGGGRNVRTQILGVTPEYQYIRTLALAYGEFISERDMQSRARSLVLGSTVAKSLFPEMDPIGQQVRVNNQPFRVTGVLEAKGGTGFANLDDLVLAPLSTVQARLFRQQTARGFQNVQVINIQAISDNHVQQAKEQIASVLRVSHNIIGDDDFTITSQQDLLQAFTQVTQAFTIFLAAIAGISLLVGGIGIMNIMLVSVTERTREIGIRKAVGAKRRDVLLQFLAESITLSVAGGAIGLALGWGASLGLSQIQIQGQPLRTLVSPDIVVIAVAVAAAVGLFFGIYPAARAARLNPIEALRYE